MIGQRNKKGGIEVAGYDFMARAGSSLDKTRPIFAAAISHRPRIRLTTRRRARVVEQHPKEIDRRLITDASISRSERFKSLEPRALFCAQGSFRRR